MKWRVMVSTPNALPVLEEYRARLGAAGCEVVVPPVRERLSEAELLPLVGDLDGMICGDDQVTERVLAAAPRLKVIAKWGTGIDSIDTAAAARRGIPVRNTPGAFTEPVADTVMAYLLAFARRPHELDRRVRAGEWPKPPLYALGEKTLGLLGTGAIGRAVARRARAFGMRVLGFDVAPPPADVLAATGIEMASKEEVLAEAHFVSLHTTLGPSTFHLVDDKALATMKPTAVLVNTARGKLVDEDALIRALQERRLAGAALDVFEVEPLPADSPLRRMDNVLLGAHHANASPAAARRVHDATIQNLLEGLRARP